MHARWIKLLEDFYKPKKNLYNVSKIPDIFDTAKHDLRHNCHVSKTRKAVCDVFNLASLLGAIIIPQEYGMTKEEKLQIAACVSMPMRAKLVHDLRCAAMKPSANADFGHESSHRFNPKGSGFLDSAVKSPNRNVRSRLYFTSESHVHAMINCLRYGGYERLIEIPGDLSIEEKKAKQDELWAESIQVLDEAAELNFLTKIVMKLYENSSYGSKELSYSKYYLEILISVGQCLDDVICTSEGEVQKQVTEMPADGLATKADTIPEQTTSVDTTAAMAASGGGVTSVATEAQQPKVMSLHRLHLGSKLEEVEEFLARFDKLVPADARNFNDKAAKKKKKKDKK